MFKVDECILKRKTTTTHTHIHSQLLNIKKKLKMKKSEHAYILDISVSYIVSEEYNKETSHNVVIGANEYANPSYRRETAHQGLHN
jgi:hypothetical protein